MTIYKTIKCIESKLTVLEREIEILKDRIECNLRHYLYLIKSSKSHYTKEDLAELLKITTPTLSNYYKNSEVKLPKRSFYSKKNYIITKQDFYDWLDNRDK